MCKIKIMIFSSTLMLTHVMTLAQEGKSNQYTTQSIKLRPVAMAELWSTYSYGEVCNDEAYNNQYDVQFRRLRFGAKGIVNKQLTYSFLIHADRLGENEFASTKNSFQGLGLWNALITARLSKANTLFNLFGGFYNIAVSRESYSTCRVLGTLDKAQPDWYLRKFLTGKGKGIESGIGMGGFAHLNTIELSYRTSVFIPEMYQHPEGNSLLYTSRFMASFGTKEVDKFKYMLSNKNWSRQEQISLGIGTAFQQNGFVNDTLLFSNSSSFGADLHIHYHSFILEGANYHLYRNASNNPHFSASLWYVKGLYNFKLWGKHLEACLSYQSYIGKGNMVLFNHIGDDKTIDTGLNWYVNNDTIKATLHYINQSGIAGTNNGDYFASSILIFLQ